MHENEKWKWSRSVVSNPQRPHGLQPTRLLLPWDFPGKSTGVGCHCLLRRLHITQHYFHEKSRISKFTDTAGILVISRDHRERRVGNDSYCVWGFYWSNKNILESDNGAGLYHCEYIKICLIVHLLWLNCMICELYPNFTNAIIKTVKNYYIL